MTTLREAAQQALDYMKSVGQMDMHPEQWAIVGRLEAALAEPVEDTTFDRWWDNALDGPTPVAPVSKETARWIWNAAKAEPVQEPVAWRYGALLYHDKLDALEFMRTSNDGYQLEPLYAAPPQRKPLTKVEISDEMTDYAITRAVEAAHGIKE